VGGGSAGLPLQLVLHHFSLMSRGDSPQCMDLLHSWCVTPTDDPLTTKQSQIRQTFGGTWMQAFNNTSIGEPVNKTRKYLGSSKEANI
jgi:hypothetical protein